MAKSGMEMALQMMGLGPVMDQVRQMAESGKADQIIAFLEKAPEIAARLERLERMQMEILHELRQRHEPIAPAIGATLALPGRSGDAGVHAHNGHSVHLFDDGDDA